MKFSIKEIEDVKLGSFYGRSNYKCLNHSCSYEVGSVLKPSCGDSCTYKLARNKAAYAPDTVMNYSLAFNMFAHTNIFDDRERALFVFDECHTLEDQLVEFDAVKLIQEYSKKWKVKWKKSSDISQVRDWIEGEYLSKLDEYLNDRQDMIEEIK